jgi:tRNA dimethylallyltransferase
MINKKLLVITGPTATGKTALGLELAERFGGEIISADSRQVYKGMDIGTGKDTEHFQWGIDLVPPDKLYSVSDWVNYTQNVLAKIEKLPIMVGGTGQYIKELLYPSETLHIPPDPELRKRLFNCSIVQLQEELQKINPDKWEAMNNSDRNNPRRLVRAIEITGKRDSGPGQNDLDALVIGLTAPFEVLYQRIDQRVEQRMAMGMEKEREKLKIYNLPNTIGYNGETPEQWQAAEHAYARRQLAYLHKYLPETRWLDITETDWQAKAYGIVKEWRQKSSN